MDQKKIMMIFLISIGLICTGFTVIALKKSDNFQNMFQEKEPQWQWEDSWNGNMPKDSNGGKSSQVKPKNSEPSPDVQVMADNYKDALQKSSELNRPVLVFYTADWCGYCKKMKSETLPDKKVIEALKKYVLVYIDTDKDRSGIGKFNVTGLPSYVVTNAKEEKIKMNSGFMNSESFVQWLSFSK